jgi:hypothetical protein
MQIHKTRAQHEVAPNTPERKKMNKYQEEVWARLTQPFPQSQLRTIETDYMSGQLHIPHQYVTKRLNDVLRWNWDFEVVNQWIKDRGEGNRMEAVTLGKLTLRIPTDPSHTKFTEAVRMQYGGKELMYKRGDSEFAHPLQVADDLKSANSRSLVKCASLFGIGLELYFQEDEEFEEEIGGDLIDNVLDLIVDTAKDLDMDKKALSIFTKKALATKKQVNINELPEYAYYIILGHLMRVKEKFEHGENEDPEASEGTSGDEEGQETQETKKKRPNRRRAEASGGSGTASEEEDEQEGEEEEDADND